MLNEQVYILRAFFFQHQLHKAVTNSICFFVSLSLYIGAALLLFQVFVFALLAKKIGAILIARIPAVRLLPILFCCSLHLCYMYESPDSFTLNVFVKSIDFCIVMILLCTNCQIAFKQCFHVMFHSPKLFNMYSSQADLHQSFSLLNENLQFCGFMRLLVVFLAYCLADILVNLIQKVQR